VSNPNYLGQMKAIMEALRMVTRQMTNGLAAGLGHSLLEVWWTTWTRGDASGPAGRWERGCSTKGTLRLLCQPV
jgi:hypothetical protein